ncbi:hypothetical protein Tco_0127770 [Tanacetum coccineum]
MAQFPILESLAIDCSKLRVDFERRSQMIIELEGLGKRGLALDCIESLRAMQKRDTEKLALLLEAWVEAHERQLVCDTMDDDA